METSVLPATVVVTLHPGWADPQTTAEAGARCNTIPSPSVVLTLKAAHERVMRAVASSAAAAARRNVRRGMPVVSVTGSVGARV